MAAYLQPMNIGEGAENSNMFDADQNKKMGLQPAAEDPFLLFSRRPL